MTRYLPVLVAFLSISVLTLFGFLISLDNFRKTVQLEFDQSASTRVAAIQNSLREKFLILESMHSLYSSFHGTPQAEFSTFMLPFETELDGVQAFQWIVPVKDKDRQQFEESMRQERIPGYQITERENQGKMIRAAKRDIYYPVYPDEPTGEIESSTGFDLGSSPVRLEAIERAIHSGAIAVSSRVNLVQEQSEGQYGFLAFAPVYIEGPQSITQIRNQESLLGFVMGVFRIRDIVAAAVNLLGTESIDLSLADLSAPPNLQHLLSYSSHTVEVAETQLPYFKHFSPQEYVATIILGDRAWSITASASPGYMISRQANLAWLILIVGTLLALLLSLYLIRSINHSRQVQQAEAELRDMEIQLFRSQKIQAIGQLAGGIAHDFNNILTSVLGYSDLARELQDETSDSKAISYIEEVIKAGTHGQELIQKLSTYSRNAPTENSLQDLEPLVNIALKLLRPAIKSNIKLSFKPEQNLPKTSIDPINFEQIVMNLCINARDAITDNDSNATGNIKITLSLVSLQNKECSSCHELANGTYVMFSVEDTGNGIPAEKVALIFDPFFTTKDLGKGTGMGLSIIHGVIHSCQGHILLDSTLGQGSTFKILLPVS